MTQNIKAIMKYRSLSRTSNATWLRIFERNSLLWNFKGWISQSLDNRALWLKFLRSIESKTAANAQLRHKSINWYFSVVSFGFEFNWSPNSGQTRHRNLDFWKASWQTCVAAPLSHTSQTVFHSCQNTFSLWWLSSTAIECKCRLLIELRQRTLWLSRRWEASRCESLMSLNLNSFSLTRFARFKSFKRRYLCTSGYFTDGDEHLVE